MNLPGLSGGSTQDPRTLARYSKPGIEAGATLTAEFDRGHPHGQ